MAIDLGLILPAKIGSGEIAINSEVDAAIEDAVYTPQQVVDEVNALHTTTIDGGAITTDSIDANRFLGSSVWVNGALQDTLFNDTPNYTTGFQLKANAAATPEDPSIYGAYIKGGTIESAILKTSEITFGGVKFLAEGSTTNSGRTGYTDGGSFSCGTVGSGGEIIGIGYIYMPLHSSGFNRARALSADSNIHINGSAYLYVDYTDVTVIYVEIEQQINAEAWTVLASQSVNPYHNNDLSYGSYSLNVTYNGTLAGIPLDAAVQYRAKIRTNRDSGYFGNISGFISLHN